MSKQNTPAMNGGTVVARGEVLPPARVAAVGTKAGSTDELKALHADLTQAYRDYLEAGKIKPANLSPAMLGLIQQFLRHNEITAEAAKDVETDAMRRRLDQQRIRHERRTALQNLPRLGQYPTE